MRSQKNRSGFTVVEMILVVVISSLIAVAAYRIFAVAAKANERVQSRIDVYRALDTAFYVIEGDFNNMVRYSFEGQSFAGEKNSIRMIIVSDAGLEVVWYFISGTKGSLVRSRQSMADFVSNQKEESHRQQVIISRSTFRDIQFQFGYLNYVDVDNPIWTTQWKQKELPFLVRVRMDAAQSKKLGNAISAQRTFLIPHGEWGKL